jgi:peptidase M42 family hydrolase
MTRPETGLEIDLDFLRRVLLELLDISSPTGRTDHIQQYVGERLDLLGVPFVVTRRGAIVADLGGPADFNASRAVVVHTDTIGAMIRNLKGNGRLELKPIGTHSARFSEGAAVRVFPDDLETVYHGQVLPLKASGHRWNEEVDSQGISWDHVEVRLDEHVSSVEDLRALGLDVGDFVVPLAHPLITDSGFVRSRHLDDKAGVAATLAALKALKEADVELPVHAQLLVTCTEEIGHGASHGLDPDVAEMVSVDAAIVAPGQQSRETAVTVAMADSVGPFDYHLTRRMHALAREHDIEVVRDTFAHYRSDAAAAIEAGAHLRVALLGFGVDASHGHERTHMDSLHGLARLLTVWLQSDLVFPRWDANAEGPLRSFPSLAVQPAQEEGPQEGPIEVDE